MLSPKSPPLRDFFISYNQADRAWAAWIAWQLEAEGFTTILQLWDFRPAMNFTLEMDRAIKATSQVLVVLSPNYLTSNYTAPEWAAYFTRDPKGSDRAILPVRVIDCTVTGLLASIVYVDLVGFEEAAAREALLGAVRDGRAKPSVPPHFLLSFLGELPHHPRRRLRLNVLGCCYSYFSWQPLAWQGGW